MQKSAKKEDDKVEKYLWRLSERSLKNVGWEDKGYSSDSGSIGVNTTEIEWQSESHWGGYSCWTDPEMCIVGVSKNS